MQYKRFIITRDLREHQSGTSFSLRAGHQRLVPSSRPQHTADCWQMYCGRANQNISCLNIHRQLFGLNRRFQFYSKLRVWKKGTLPQLHDEVRSGFQSQGCWLRLLHWGDGGAGAGAWNQSVCSGLKSCGPHRGSVTHTPFQGTLHPGWYVSEVPQLSASDLCNRHDVELSTLTSRTYQGNFCLKCLK